jgi:hypothetical protein
MISMATVAMTLAARTTSQALVTLPELVEDDLEAAGRESRAR